MPSSRFSLLLLLLSFFLLLLGLSTSAQSVAFLQAGISASAAGHRFVTLTNTYSAIARAYIIECDYPMVKGTQSLVISHDGLGGPPPFAVAPGKSQSVGCPFNTMNVTVKAVAYDDGKTEGDAASLAKIAAERQLEAQEVAADIQILQNALATFPTAPSQSQINQLTMQFVQQAQKSASTILGPAPRDFVSSWIIQGLAGPVQKQPITTVIRGQIGQLQKFAAILPQPTQTTTAPPSAN